MLLLPKTPPLTYPNIKKIKGPQMDSLSLFFTFFHNHGGRRSLAGLESVTLHPFPPTFAFDPSPHTHPHIRSPWWVCVWGGGGRSRANVGGNGWRVTDSKPASNLLPPWSISFLSKTGQFHKEIPFKMTKKCLKK